jgi:hypothetical protein
MGNVVDKKNYFNRIVLFLRHYRDIDMLYQVD